MGIISTFYLFSLYLQQVKTFHFEKFIFHLKTFFVFCLFWGWMAAVIGTPCMSFHDCFRRAPKVRRPIKAACLSASIGVQMSLSTRCWPPQVTRPLLTTFRDRSSCPVTGHTVKYTQQHHHSFPRPDKGRGHTLQLLSAKHLYPNACYIHSI